MLLNFLMSMNVFFQLIGSDLMQILNDNCAEIDSNSSDFWVMVAALKVCNLFELFLR